jgi:hypothetical protein
MKGISYMLALASLAIMGTALGAGAPGAATSYGDCGAMGGLHFVCGLHEPEDLAQVGTHWIITTGMATDGTGGLYLVDTRARQSQRLQFGEQIALQPDRSRYPNCPSEPQPSSYSTQGLNLRATGQGHYQLNVVAHGSREAIDAFDVDATQAQPVVTWRGCVPLPETGGNSVTSAADGSLYVTIFVRPGYTFQQMLDGKPTGELLVWHPGQMGFQHMAGLSASGANGIEISPDGQRLYIAMTGTRDMIEVPVADPTHVLHRVDFYALDFAPDNVHWTRDGQLVVAGMREREPDCGNLSQRDASTKPQYQDCHRAAVVALVNPETLQGHVVFAARQANAHYTGTSTAVVMNGDLWLGSFGVDRIAYVPLTSAQQAAFRSH